MDLYDLCHVQASIAKESVQKEMKDRRLVSSKRFVAQV